MRTVGEAQISLGYIACNSALDPAFFQPVNETRLVAIGGTRTCILDRSEERRVGKECVP